MPDAAEPSGGTSGGAASSGRRWWPPMLGLGFFLAGLLAFSIFLFADAPLEEPANPNLTMDPGKAPWYFLGPTEITLYLDPWIALTLPYAGAVAIAVGLAIVFAWWPKRRRRSERA